MRIVHLLVNSNVTQDFELFRHKIGANIQEIKHLHVNKLFSRISLDIKS
ncbi:hypothetical protein Q8G35_23695 [Peribacillus simplex]|uniref:Uncharacterized protein n=2 Tax=Peribacillus TaxID=2675229 RepID=A0AA90PM41_9BACI|nr:MULTISPECIES: hypothetical protein [Peribacillus]MDP1421295.1 hypothetical protein [Peribacillus simplex]MDP1452990.1 hypothetical protein [Peribacillus frigoritolerans]